jgi:hypothetical protein
MASRLVKWSLDHSVVHVPGLRRVPVLKVLAAANIALLTRDHVMRLKRHERRRLVELVRIGAAHRGKLSAAEREELAMLVSRMEPRLLAGHAVDEFSPFPLPRRLLYGRRR